MTRNPQRFASAVRKHSPAKGMKNVPKRPRAGHLDPRRLANRNLNYKTSRYLSVKKYGTTLDRIVDFLIRNERLEADPESGQVFIRRTRNCQWKKITVTYNHQGRQQVRLYATINGTQLRIQSTLARVTYLIYHGAHTIPDHHDIDHADDDKKNNRLDNLVPLWYNVNRSRYKNTRS